MSTVYSGNYSTGTYTYTRVRVDYSGTSATAHLLYTRTNAWYDPTSATGATFTFGGASVGFSKSFSGPMTDAEVASVSFTISTSGGTYSGSTGGAGLLSFSGSVNIPAQGSAPSAGYINGLAVSYNGTELEFSSTSVGVNDGGLALSLNRFEICNVPLTQSGIPAQIKSFTNGQPITLSQTDSTSHDGGITIVGNHLYYSGLAAMNSAGLYYYNGPSIVTPCVPATVSLYYVTNLLAAISYSTVADGGYYDKTIQYSLDNGATWTTAITITGGTAQSGTFTITGLTPSTSYTLKTRVQTTAGTTNNTDLTFTTSAVNPQMRLYGSISDDTTRVGLLYGSVNDQTKRIIKVYGSDNGLTKRIY